MIRRRLALVTLAPMLAALLAAGVGVGPADARVVHRPAPRSSVAHPIGGERFTLAGSLGRSTARPVLLQRKVGKRWVKVRRATIPASGRYRFTVTQAAGRLSWRAVARLKRAHGKSYPRRVSKVRTLTKAIQSGSLTGTHTVRAGSRIALTATFSPARRGRAVEFQIDAGSGWRTLARGTQGPAGRAGHTWTSTAQGVVRFRAVEAGWNGTASLTTPVSTAYVLPATPVQVAAHRGYSARFAENSWHAYDQALKTKAEWIETDLRRTAPNPTDVVAVGTDPVPPGAVVDPTGDCVGPAGTRFWIVMHDATFKRTTNVATLFPGRQDDPTTSFTCQEVRRLDNETWKTPKLTSFGVPTLGLFVQWMADLESRNSYASERILLEYKGSKPDEFADLYDEVKTLAPTWIDPASHSDKVVFTSFGYPTAFTPVLDPAWGGGSPNTRVGDGAELGAILDQTTDPLPQQPAEIATHWLQAQIASPLLTKASAAAAHQVVDQVAAWTIDSPTGMLQAAANGADIIITNNVPNARATLLR